MAFFLISSLGVIASPAIERLRRWGLLGEILMWLTTLTFITATAALMFTTFNYIVPLYHQRTWLMW